MNLSFDPLHRAAMRKRFPSQWLGNLFSSAVKFCRSAQRSRRPRPRQEGTALWPHCAWCRPSATASHRGRPPCPRYGHLSSLHKVEATVQLLPKPRQPRRISGVPACQQRKVGKHRLPVTCRRVNLRRLAEQSCLLSIEGKCHLHKRTGCAAQLTIHLHGYTVVRSHIRKQLPQDVAVPIDLRVDSVKTLRRCALSSAPVIKPHAASPLHGLYRTTMPKAMHRFR